MLSDSESLDDDDVERNADLCLYIFNHEVAQSALIFQ